MTTNELEILDWWQPYRIKISDNESADVKEIIKLLPDTETSIYIYGSHIGENLILECCIVLCDKKPVAISDPIIHNVDNQGNNLKRNNNIVEKRMDAIYDCLIKLNKMKEETKMNYNNTEMKGQRQQRKLESLLDYSNENLNLIDACIEQIIVLESRTIGSIPMQGVENKFPGDKQVLDNDLQHLINNTVCTRDKLRTLKECLLRMNNEL